MKKALVAAILGVAGSVATTYGQGVVQFNNYQSYVYNPVRYNSSAGSAPAGDAGENVNDPNVEVALFYALGTYSSVGSFLTAAGSAVGTTFIDTTKNSGGTYGAGTPGGYYDDSSPITLAGWSSTTAATATFYVEAWETSGTYAGGGTYTNSLLTGASGLWTETTAVTESGANPGTYGIVPSADPSDTFLSGPPTTIMSTVPEPTTLALAGLGGLASLVAFRRKQS